MRTQLFLLTAAALLAACGDTAPADAGHAAAIADSAASSVTDGHQVLYTKDGGRMEGDLVGGLRSGPWVAYFPDGTVRSRSTFVDGLEEGPTEVYHANGQLYYHGNYRRGRSIGEWVFYDAQGGEAKRVRYDSTGAMLK